MSVKSLPQRIAALMSVGILVFLGGLWVSVDSIRRGMNEQAAQDSVSQVASRFDTLHEQVRLMVRDYNNWADVFKAAQVGDLDFIADNYGITAIYGDIFDGVVMFDGPFPEPIAWVKGGPREPGPSFLPSYMLPYIRAGVANHVPGVRQTFDFMMLRNGVLNFVSASHLLPDVPELLEGVTRDQVAIAVISRTLRASELRAKEAELSVSDLRVVLTRPAHSTALPVMGVDGRPIAYLAWAPPRPGDRLLHTMTPVLGFVSATFVALALTGTIVIHANARNLVRREAEAAQLARTDSLTGLPNRLAFIEHLRSVEDTPVNRLALMLIDLNGFKKINDMIGHPGGDAIVSDFADRLKPLADRHTFVARVGGDEFVVVMTSDKEIGAQIKKVTSAVAERLSRPFCCQGYSFDLTAAQGLAIREDPAQTTEELVRRADRAMYHAKGNQSGEVKLYNDEMELASRADRAIERALRTALARPEEFSIHYQPIIDAKTNRVVRAEALARWRCASIGSVDPDRFVAVAEAAGMIPTLGWLLFEKICADLVRCPALRVSINVSPLQLILPDFIAETQRRLTLHGITPDRIEIELTEGIVVQNSDMVAWQLDRMLEAGLTTALDDFGTGFSSIGYLRRMPFSTLKIDRSFISNPTTYGKNADIVRSIILLGHSIGKTITCEGVETAEQAEELRAKGCDLLQGFHFGRPQPLNDFVRAFPEFGMALVN